MLPSRNAAGDEELERRTGAWWQLGWVDDASDDASDGDESVQLRLGTTLQ